MNKKVLSGWRNALKSTAVAASLCIPSLACADVILHAFNWSYTDVKNKASEISSIGYKAVLVAPPLKSAKNGCEWWQRYQPQDWRVIDHCLGNKESFKAMIDALQAKGVVVYADIVLNHMANERNGATDFPGNSTLVDYANNRTYWNKQKLFGNLDNGLLSPWDFHEAKCISNYNDVWQVQNWRICGAYPDKGLPDLNPNSYVVDQQRAYLQALKNLGVKGFRVDAAKHMTNWHMNQIFTSSIKSGMHVFGEVITGGGTSSSDYQQFLGPYLSGTDHDAYDFPLLNAMRNALQPNGWMSSLDNPVAGGNALPGDRAVTMPITHDIPTNAGFRYLIMNTTDEHLAYAYVLGRKDGAPMVFSDQTGTDGGRWVNDYKQSDIKAMVKFHNRVKGQGQEGIWADQCVLAFRRGKEGVVGINKCGEEKWIKLNTNEKYYWYRNYTDVFSGETFSIDASVKWIRIPPRAARMWTAS
ncbi:alpha-amylase family protein [Simiduia agarivorans]|uniref:Alpha-amylase n=1 Tax=Simiduia agarivorans (strain DSM 21679 / JCM 13881 / BCRC 17597 / SA1) TaxID=1117647 RepID=K4KJZ3_SIMAS|nr:alpha-amylase family protein [Simiduia agarivorans]AFU98550.1 alpha-amylase, extracellular [Simiduia agarivorans SA1 = DSM 21679]